MRSCSGRRRRSCDAKARRRTGGKGLGTIPADAAPLAPHGWRVTFTRESGYEGELAISRSCAGGFFCGGMYAYIAGTPFACISYRHVPPQLHALPSGVGIIRLPDDHSDHPET
jgi:hypothetical protein